MNDQELQDWIQQISLCSFGLPFLHEAKFNARLRTTGGRYFMKSHNIEINPSQLAAYGREETEKIIKHELCHYHLHLQGKGYLHRDPEFKRLLKQVGGARFCQRLPDAKVSARKPLPYRYKLVCKTCGQEYLRKRMLDPARYRCSKCTGRLKLIELK